MTIASLKLRILHYVFWVRGNCDRLAGYATGSAAIDTSTSLAIDAIAGYAKAVRDPAMLTERVHEIEGYVA